MSTIALKSNVAPLLALLALAPFFQTPHADAQLANAFDPFVSAPQETTSAIQPTQFTDVWNVPTATVTEPTPEDNLARANSLPELVDELASPSTEDAEHNCLAATVYFESRAEPLEGQLAVAEVVLNRTEAPQFRRATVCGVVRAPYQFSFVRRGRIPNPDRSSRAWHRAVAIARIARDNLWESRAAKALYFHADYVAPKWRHRFRRQAVLGNHIFYR